MRTASALLRGRLLDLLREAQGWVSGEDLAAAFGMSRAALAKHIASLRQAGHVIDAAPRRGYRLVSEAEAFTLESIRSRLATRLIGQGAWRWFERSGSTNREALRLALEDAPQGSVVVAAIQDAGRASCGRSWHSPAGGLYISFVLRPSFAVPPLRLFTHLSAVAACECARQLGAHEARVKWPNDVRSRSRKLSGSLTEAGMVGERLEWIVVGAGINVNTRLEEMPPEVAGRATSLYLESGRSVSRAEVARLFLERADAWYASLTKHGSAPLVERWKALSETIGRPVRLAVDGEIVEAIARDMDGEGRLILTDARGRRYRLGGEVGA